MPLHSSQALACQSDNASTLSRSDQTKTLCKQEPILLTNLDALCDKICILYTGFTLTFLYHKKFPESFSVAPLSRTGGLATRNIPLLYAHIF